MEDETISAQISEAIAKLSWHLQDYPLTADSPRHDISALIEHMENASKFFNTPPEHERFDTVKKELRKWRKVSHA
jgi:hypothetical protein